MASVNVKVLPKDAQIIHAVLKDMGINDYDSRVVNQLLEFTFRYVADVLDDAKIYSTHANKKNIDVEDIKLAVQCKLDHSFTTPPPRELLLDVARHKNTTPLPLIKPFTGPKLPPDRYCLTTTNYRLRPLRKNMQGRIQSQSSTLVPGLTGPPRIVIGQPFTAKSINAVSSGKVVVQPTVTMRSAAPVSMTTTQPQPVFRFTQGTPASMSHGFTSDTMTNANSLKRKRDDDDYDV